MSTWKKKKQPSGRKVTPASKKRVLSAKWVILGLAGVAVAAGILIYHLRYANTDSTKASQSVEAKGNRATSPSGDNAVKKLIGSWRRLDGGYIIDILRIDADGQMSAAYYNPKSIHVSRAAASLNDETVSVFIELNDVGYPGSAYTLAYHPQQDILSGVYFQAAVKQTFKVIFTRVN